MECVICARIDCTAHKDFITAITKRILPKLLNTNDLNDSIRFLFSQKVCTICEYRQVIDFAGNLTKEAIVEHNHETEDDKGSIRGLVCKSCNVIEGKYRKSVLSGITHQQCTDKYGIYWVTKMETYYAGKGGITPMEYYTPEEDLMEID